MATYLVTGATGHQGGAVVTELLAIGVKVHAVVRDLKAPKAVALRDRGVVLFEGTNEEPDTVFRAAAAGVTGLFLNPSVFAPGAAKAQADAIINAVKAGAGSSLKIIVLSSSYRTAEISGKLETVGAVEPLLGYYYGAKAEVEAAVRESGVQHYTILRPAVMNYDYLLPNSAAPEGFAELPREAKLVTSMDDNATLPMVDPNDVARFTVAAFQDPAKFGGHEIELGSENLTAREVRDILAKVSGIDIKFHKRTPAEVEEARKTVMFQAFELLANAQPHRLDVKALDKYGIKVVGFEEYMEKNKEKLLDSLPPRSAVALPAA